MPQLWHPCWNLKKIVKMKLWRRNNTTTYVNKMAHSKFTFFPKLLQDCLKIFLLIFYRYTKYVLNHCWIAQNLSDKTETYFGQIRMKFVNVIRITIQIKILDTGRIRMKCQIGMKTGFYCYSYKQQVSYFRYAYYDIS